MAEVVDGEVFQRTQIKKEKAEARAKGASTDENPLDRYAHAQSLVLRAQAASIALQHTRVLSQEEKGEQLMTVRDRLRRLFPE